MEENAQKIAELLKVLANENRLLILCALTQQQCLTVNEIAKYIPAISQSGLSQHLSLLKAHGILSSKKNGLNITYSIADHRVEEVMGVLKKHYCPNKNEVNE